VVKALTYGPTGAIAAAATTSLPECVGGVRNWDYRYCWPRDAAVGAHALVQLGITGPAIKLLDWMLGILDQVDPASLISPVYTVSGRHLGPEAELGHLSGYRGSRPVRIGNAAAAQVQLDVFGPLAELIAALAERGAPVTPEHWRLTEWMVESVARHWREPDHGIWEIRLPRRQHVHSKVMCWFTMDRALAIARYLGRKKPEWAQRRDEIATDVLSNGWSARRGAYGASYEDDAPDAGALWVGLSGLLPADDPRFVGTISYVARTLRRGPTVHRYRFDDGLPGLEGGFHLCTAWLIEALFRTGQTVGAAELFEQFTRLAGPTGLLAEEWAPESRRALGNYPQVYSHAGLIKAALLLADQTN
jgi:GH15 family glucan-1,4-alpha-glucosidase